MVKNFNLNLFFDRLFKMFKKEIKRTYGLGLMELNNI